MRYLSDMVAETFICACASVLVVVTYVFVLLFWIGRVLYALGNHIRHSWQSRKTRAS